MAKLITNIKKIKEISDTPERYIYRGDVQDALGDYYAIFDDVVMYQTYHIVNNDGKFA